MKISQRKNIADEKFRFSVAHKCLVTFVGVCLLLSYYGIIKGSFAHIVAGVAVITGVGFLKNSFSRDQVDRLN